MAMKEEIVMRLWSAIAFPTIAGLALFSLSITVPGVYAQSTSTARPEFEAASIKLNISATGGHVRESKGQIRLTQTLKGLIARAYDVEPFQVTGPGWMENVYFDVTAKFPPDTKTSDHELMLRTLLEDRFKLAVHRELRDIPGYSLVVAKSGFKLKPVEPGENHVSGTGERVQTLTVAKVSMPQLVEYLNRSLGQIVIDKTDIEGVYDFSLRWAKADLVDPTDTDAAPSLFAAVEDTLGLRLQPQKVPADVIVVDHAEQVPTGN